MDTEKSRARGRDIGKTGATVAANVKRLRSEHTSLRELEAKLESLGVKISASGLQKIEAGTRRVDTDELMALSIALNVNPNALLLPDDASYDDVSDKVTAADGQVTGDEVWDWANGFRMLSTQSPLRMLKGLHDGPMSDVVDILELANAAHFDTALVSPDVGDEADYERRMTFQAHYHAKNLKKDEVLSLWRINAEGQAAEVFGLPYWPDHPRLWISRIKKTVLGIATNSTEATMVRDDLQRALKDPSDGND